MVWVSLRVDRLCISCLDSTEMLLDCNSNICATQTSWECTGDAVKDTNYPSNLRTLENSVAFPREPSQLRYLFRYLKHWSPSSSLFLALLPVIFIPNALAKILLATQWHIQEIFNTLVLEWHRGYVERILPCRILSMLLSLISTWYVLGEKPYLYYWLAHDPLSRQWPRSPKNILHRLTAGFRYSSGCVLDSRHFHDWYVHSWCSHSLYAVNDSCSSYLKAKFQVE
jgi:hypothetical protein